MRQYLTTDGRFSRIQFWKFIAVFFAYCAILGFIGNIFESETMNLIVGLLILPMLIIFLFVQVKRWHDLNQTGWLVLINIVPLIGGIISLVCLGFIKGTNGGNKYGTDPLAKSDQTDDSFSANSADAS